MRVLLLANVPTVVITSKPLVGTITTVANAIVDPRAGYRCVSTSTGLVAFLEAAIKPTLRASIGSRLIAAVLGAVAIIVVHPTPTDFSFPAQATEHRGSTHGVCIDVPQSNATKR